MFIRKRASLFIWPFLLMVVLAACNNNGNNQNSTTINNDSIPVSKDSSVEVAQGKFDMVISDIPFPFEILDNLYSKHIPFDQKVMNSVSNVSKYNQYNSKALNLGIYGADLAYSVTFEEFQQMGTYVKATKKLAEELNIPYAFNQEMMDKYSKYKDNKDSLTKIVYDSYNQVDRQLKNDDRVGIAALVVTGSWIEGLYLSTKTFLNVPKTNENSSMYKVIGGQKQSLNIVIKLLEEYKKDVYISRIIDDLKEITSEYNQVSSDITLNEKQLVSINSKVEKLRTRIIEGL